MAGEGIAAEVLPTAAQHTTPAVTALQERGFRVLHVGMSISVQAPRRVWEETFGVVFTPHTTTVQAQLDRQVTYQRADPESVRVPADLQSLIADVAFAEPPDLH